MQQCSVCTAGRGLVRTFSDCTLVLEVNMSASLIDFHLLFSISGFTIITLTNFLLIHCNTISYTTSIDELKTSAIPWTFYNLSKTKIKSN